MWNNLYILFCRTFCLIRPATDNCRTFCPNSATDNCRTLCPNSATDLCRTLCPNSTYYRLLLSDDFSTEELWFNFFDQNRKLIFGGRATREKMKFINIINNLVNKVIFYIRSTYLSNYFSQQINKNISQIIGYKTACENC